MELLDWKFLALFAGGNVAVSKLNVDQFLDTVRRSGLLEQDQLTRIVAELDIPAGSDSPEHTAAIVNRLVDAKLLTRWQCDQLLAGKHRGFTLGKYRLLDHLGSGGMSSVYLAEHVLMQRRVAIKVLPKNRVDDSSYLARFHREARAAAALDHRNIVRAYDVDNDGPHHYLVMEYVDGRDLQRIVQSDGVLDPLLAADYIRQAAEGLSHAHQAGLIHRDVKPANLLLDRNGVVKVLDLGLARFTDDERASLTVAHDENVLGTADYLAPEQAINSHGVDARADIYSLGCSLYFLLTGHPPFCEGTLPQRLMAHQRSQPPAIENERSDVPPDLIAICMRMMAKKAAARYQSMAEVAAVLTDWLTAHGRTPEASAGGSSTRLANVIRAAAQSIQENPAGLRRKPGTGGSNSSGLRRAQPLAPADTSPGIQDATRKGPADSGAHRAAPSGSKIVKSLPQGKPASQAQPAGAGALDFLDQIDTIEERPTVRRVRRPRRGLPIWLWALIGGTAILVIALLIVALKQM